MLILGAICIGLIVWFLLSENSPVNARSTQLKPITQISSDVVIEIKRKEESYWANFSDKDTLKSGDFIRSNQDGNAVFNVADFGYLELKAPFEIGIVQENSSSPSEFELNSGTIQYFYSFESTDIPRSVSTPNGKFIVNEISDGNNTNKEFIISNSSGNVQITMLSGVGSWIESGQNALVRKGEILNRSQATKELFKSSISNTNTISITSSKSATSDSVQINWPSVENINAFKYRIFELLNDTLKLNHTQLTNSNSIVIPPVPDGEFVIQISPMIDSNQIGNWSMPFDINQN